MARSDESVSGVSQLPCLLRESAVHQGDVDIIGDHDQLGIDGMTTAAHDLAPGYYWYSQDGDPYCVLHVHDNGSASLMGTDAQVSAHDVALMIARGCSFAWIEPPALQP